MDCYSSQHLRLVGMVAAPILVMLLLLPTAMWLRMKRADVRGVLRRGLADQLTANDLRCLDYASYLVNSISPPAIYSLPRATGSPSD